MQEQEVINTQEETKEVEIPQLPEGTRIYDNSHFAMYCGKCNTKTILERDIPSNRGIQINLPPTNKSEFTLVCKECGNKMGVFYIEDVKPVTTDESMQDTTPQTTDELTTETV